MRHKAGLLQTFGCSGVTFGATIKDRLSLCTTLPRLNLRLFESPAGHCSTFWFFSTLPGTHLSHRIQWGQTVCGFATGQLTVADPGLLFPCRTGLACRRYWRRTWAALAGGAELLRNLRAGAPSQSVLFVMFETNANEASEYLANTSV